MGQKLIDETGKKYGKLTVISLTKDKNNRTAWLCNCTCGNTVIARGPDLRNGRITSCGCNKGKSKTIDITGKQYGSLTAIKYEYSKNNKQYWSFLCTCGNTCIKQKASVINKHTSSCGCKSDSLNSFNNRVLGEIGTIYGLQEIVENRSVLESRGYTIVKCRCIKCGREKEFNLPQLKHNKTASCLCTISYPEYEIEQWLIQNNINFKFQYSFKDLQIDPTKYKTKLRFDYGILDEENNLLGLIEYNGEQHYRQLYYDDNIYDLYKRQIYDQKKIEYCKKNNLPLLILTKDSDKNKMLQVFIQRLRGD